MGKSKSPSTVHTSFDWRHVARMVLRSRFLDLAEEQKLYPEGKIVYQFSAKGHELCQVLLASLLDRPFDAVSAYYRSRPLLLTLGLSLEDAFSGPLGKSGGYSDGRDIGVVCNFPNPGGPSVLPMAGDVGSQYTPSSGWAEAIEYYQYVLGDDRYKECISVVCGGEGSVATNGFWSALTMATTLNLPQLFFIEDNGYAISVPSDKQTPGGNIADNLRSFNNLHIVEGDGCDPEEAASCISEAVSFVRLGQTPALIRLEVPRLCGHSGQDSQAYKEPEELKEELERDPLPRLKEFLVPAQFSESEWDTLAHETSLEVDAALEAALSRTEPDPQYIKRFAFSERVDAPATKANSEPLNDGPRINMLEGIRRVLSTELASNPKVAVFGEDVGPKGGVHAATMGLQELFGEYRVFDTSLSEEGIIGRAVGMAIAGLVPVAEIQFRKYADPATEQLNNCGTIRWRTNNRFSAPIIVRMAGGYSRKAGDPWHSVSGEAVWLHQAGWQFVVPSNTVDAVGLLRTVLRSDNPTMFFEHRALLDSPDARGPYPGDEFCIPLGKAKVLREGTALSVITWGAMVERALAAADQIEQSIEILDLRTLCPWDKEAVFSSIQKTKRALILHEDGLAVGFGAEIAAQLAEEAFFSLDAPIKRIASANLPIPYNPILMREIVPSVETICQGMREVLSF